MPCWVHNEERTGYRAVHMCITDRESIFRMETDDGCRRESFGEDVEIEAKEIQ